MNRSVICVHCGKTLGLAARTDPLGEPLVAHLSTLHREVVALEALPRWADLFEHFRVVPLRYPLIPRVVHA